MTVCLINNIKMNKRLFYLTPCLFPAFSTWTLPPSLDSWTHNMTGRHTLSHLSRCSLIYGSGDYPWERNKEQKSCLLMKSWDTLFKNKAEETVIKKESEHEAFEERTEENAFHRTQWEKGVERMWCLAGSSPEKGRLARDLRRSPWICQLGGHWWHLILPVTTSVS